MKPTPALRCAMAAASLCLAATAHAKIDLVTLPAHGATELTIYNSHDLTLVRETRTLPFSQGLNEIQFSWANTLIDPTSLHIRLLDDDGLIVQDAVYPANTKDMIVWNIEADKSTVSGVEISYFTSGLTWSSDYVLRANAAETQFAIQQFTTVRNKSGEDFDHAKTRVVVGSINLIDAITKLANLKGKRTAPEFDRELPAIIIDESAAPVYPADPANIFQFTDAFALLDYVSDQRTEAAEIIKKAVSEYYLFAVDGTNRIANGYDVELPNPEAIGVPFDLSYEIDLEKYGTKAIKFYKLKNDTNASLGKEPLPEGSYYVYSDDGRRGLRFEGKTRSNYVPVGEDIELNLGSDGLLLFEGRLMSASRDNFEFDTDGNRIGWDETWQLEFEITNSRDREVPVKLTHHLDGDWKVISTSAPDYEKLDRRTLRWENIKVPARTATTIALGAVFSLGSRARDLSGATP